MDSPARKSEGTGLGDIMCSEPHDKAIDDLTVFTPLQRVALTANGNLQRIVSAFHDLPVSVDCRKNERSASGVYERIVDLVISGVIFARCWSTVTVTRADLVRAIEEDGVAIGQLFRQMAVLPRFELFAAGKLDPGDSHSLPEGSDKSSGADMQSGTATPDAFINAQVSKFWRRYTLQGDGVHCAILEEIRCDALDPTLIMPTKDDRAKAAARRTSLGDIVAPNATFARCPTGFTPSQRLLLSANGNVERILSSYYARPIQLFVVENHRRSDYVYDRKTAFLLDGQQLGLAKTTCFITDEKWQEAMDEERLPIGALFRRFDALPAFKLFSAALFPGGFWRQYQLKAPGLTCEINETFEDDCFDARRFPSPSETVDVCDGCGYKTI